MKQLIANRSGATPTLDEVPNETIKIYDSDQDLDTDVSNLEENEIVATRDSSGDTADIVESLREYVDEYVEDNTQPKSKVWVAALPDPNVTTLNLVGIVIPNASKVTSVGFQWGYRDGQASPIQYVYVDLANNSSFRIGVGIFNAVDIISGTYNSTNDTWTITSKSSSSLSCKIMKVNYSEDITVKSN